MDYLSKRNGLICFLCQRKGPNLINTQDMVTIYTEIPILKILERCLRSTDMFLQEICVAANDKLCRLCLAKVNDYDFAYETAKRISDELASLIENANRRLKLRTKRKVDYTTNEHDISDHDESCLEQDLNKIVAINAVITRQNDLTDNEVLHMKSEPKDETETYVKKLNNESILDSEILLKESTRNGNKLIQPLKTEVNISSIRQSNDPVSENTSTIIHKCTHKGCQAEFVTAKEFLAHRKQLGHKKYHVCSICDQRFDAKSRYFAHMAFHNGGDCPFQCDICGRKFTQHVSLKRHHLIHTGEKAYQCDHCGKQFIHETSFRAHKFGHENIRGKKCPVCEMLLGPNASLNIHMRSHTGEKPHECPTCGKKFSSRRNMTVHYNAHQGIKQDSVKICSICSKSFPRIGKLKQHLAREHNITSPFDKRD